MAKLLPSGVALKGRWVASVGYHAPKKGAKRLSYWVPAGQIDIVKAFTRSKGGRK